MSNITIHRPNLTPEERKMRMDEIKRAAAKIIIAQERQKIKKAQAEK